MCEAKRTHYFPLVTFVWSCERKAWFNSNSSSVLSCSRKWCGGRDLIKISLSLVVWPALPSTSKSKQTPHFNGCEDSLCCKMKFGFYSLQLMKWPMHSKIFGSTISDIDVALQPCAPFSCIFADIVTSSLQQHSKTLLICIIKMHGGKIERPTRR